MITGSSGVGKTRFIRELAFRLKIKENQVFRIDMDQSLSYDLDIIGIFLNVLTYNADNNILERYKESFIKFIPEKYGYRESYVNESSVHKAELYKLFNRICSYLKEIALDKPVYILIDNIENYNETFHNLIDYLLQALFNSKVFIIFTNNNLDESRNLFNKSKKWKEDKLIEEIVIGNLSKEDIAILTKDILGMSFTPFKFASVLYESCKGNPRFLDIIIKELFNKKELYISGKGMWHLEKDNYSDLSLPTDFKTTIMEQTKDIDGDKLDVLKLISISHDSMSKFILYNMLDFDINYLNNIIVNLLNEQILVESSYDNSFYYDFLSNDLKLAVYLEIANEEKKLLHNNLAELLIEHRPNTIRDLVEEISYHLVKADKRVIAADLIVSEASKIVNIYADKAVSLWEMAFSIVKDISHEKKIIILERLARINLHMTNVEKTQLYLDEFSKEADKLGDLDYIFAAKNYYAELYLINNEMKKLDFIIEDVERLSSGNNYLEGKILSYVLTIGSLSKDYSANRSSIKNMLDKALSLSKENKVSKYLGKLYFQYGLFNAINGQAEESIKYYEMSLEYLEKNRDIYETIKAINNIGNVYLEALGDKDRSFIYFKEGLRLANEYGFSHLESVFLLNIGEAYLNILDYKRALDYTNKSIRVCQINKDISVQVVSNCNLGRIYLLTNQLDKAYEVYTYLINLHMEDIRFDSDLVLAYRNYLAEFYFNFGHYELSIKYSKLAKEMAEEFSLNYYFRSLFRLIHIDYIRGKIDKDEIFSVLREYMRGEISEVYIWNIFILISNSLCRFDSEFAEELMKYHLKPPLKKEPELIRETGHMLSLLLNSRREDLKELEYKINKIENRKDYNIDLRLYIQLANLYEDLGEYKKSMGYNIKAFDGIYKAVDSVEELHLKLSFIESLGVERVKTSINNILEKYYYMRIGTLNFNEVTDSNFHEYFDLTPVIDSLTKKEIDDIVPYKGETGIESVNELISSLDEDYMNNIKMILNYIGKETLAQRGFILKYNENRSNLIPLVSLDEDDKKLPNDIVLMQSLKNKYGFLFNFSFQGLRQNKLSACLPKNTRGIICLPIMNRKSQENKGFSDSFYNKEKDVYGYIYLETDNALHRFDLERSKLIYSLERLIVLNLQNEKLRINSTTDKLTGIYSREYFELQLGMLLEKYRSSNKNLCLCMVDIDRFKSFNDKYGHLKGDEVLALVARTIKNVIDSKGMVGRYGGEEFIILLEDCHIEEAYKIAKEIKNTLEHSHIPGIEDKITISIGIAQYPIHGSYQIELTTYADQALYHAKEVLSRNSIAVWDRDMKGRKKNVDKSKGLITSNSTESNRNILQIADIAESIKENNHIDDKIFQLLGTIITISNCEYATFIEYNENKTSKYYTRKRQTNDWAGCNHIKENLVAEVKWSKMGIFTIGWNHEIEDEFNLPDWDSILITPLIKKGVVEAMIYIAVPLREKEFNQENLNVINVLSNIFSGNY